jgi:hypothetical protein
MHIRDYFTAPELAAPPLTEGAAVFGDRSDAAPEKLAHESAGSYNRALATLILAVADGRAGRAGPRPATRPRSGG